MNSLSPWQWTGRGDITRGPPQSLDCTLLDFSLWDYIVTGGIIVESTIWTIHSFIHFIMPSINLCT
jgi:hypothetical protein